MKSAHTTWCNASAFGHSDAARRTADQYELHRMVAPQAHIGKWFATALADGTGDGVLYDSKYDCVTHQHHNEQYYAYVQITPASMSYCEAEVFLVVHRRMYDSNVRLTDPEVRHGGPDVIPRLNAEDQYSMLHSIRTRGRSRPSNLIIP